MITLLTLLAAAQGGLTSESPTPTNLEQEPKVWSGNVDGGLTMVSGNSESTTGSVNAKASRTWGAWAAGVYAGYTGVRSTNAVTGDATTTSRIITAGADGRRYLDANNNLYVFVKAGDRRDEPSGLVERMDLGGGVGYKFDLYENAFLGLEGGVSWVTEELVGVTDDESTAAARVSYLLEAPLVENLNAFGNGEYLNGGDVESFTSLTGLRWNFRPKWSLMASIQFNYDGSPAPGFEDTDTIFVLGIGLEF